MRGMRRHCHRKQDKKKLYYFNFIVIAKGTRISVKVLWQIVASSMNNQRTVSGKSKSDTHFIFNIREFRRNQSPNLCI